MDPTLGPILLDLEGLALTAEERELLAHPAVGGVILFARNYADPEQLRALTRAIRAATPRSLLVTVDQEGGRVQRLRAGFTALPAPARLGAWYRQDPAAACQAAADLAWLAASELRAVDIDLSFAPVLDLDHGRSAVIGDRAFAATPDAVCALADAWCAGLRAAGMRACGKHFPGHGGVVEDSHHALPVDPRPLTELKRADLVPFARLSPTLAAIMPAHVVYPAVDARPAGFAARWLQDLLRGQLGFAGAIVSDDLGMVAARIADTPSARAHAALAAGCDLVLVCNDRAAAVTVIEEWPNLPDDPRAAARRAALRATPPPVAADPARRRRALDFAVRLAADASPIAVAPPAL